MLKPSLQLRIGQQLTMTPQLQQAIRLLQLPSLDLQAHVRETLETNVMLEAEDELAADAAADAVRGPEEAVEEKYAELDGNAPGGAQVFEGPHASGMRVGAFERAARHVAPEQFSIGPLHDPVVGIAALSGHDGRNARADPLELIR